MTKTKVLLYNLVINVNNIIKDKPNEYIGEQNIDFVKFCKAMKVFNPKSPAELKIRCNGVYSFSLLQLV